ncbi:guanine-specific ribonuclease N1 and T1 [Pseudoxanthomonas suwonensis 11-1]|uniref:Guanine-specific ribonuclease N1 and T1 n=1 Tax=Pseudoxanthomonas suwonensis (strain 11-1) TaxID=743721 RepID=E6WT69_PSEUU|nr:ribonuclease domain-containing protein [Pseudoxanthomonas suwonensis]ADV27298.1 guanine-specific ribonuclease N1 and T1 [Pseudoxanthomonas suwonensis 11-1]
MSKRQRSPLSRSLPLLVAALLLVGLAWLQRPGPSATAATGAPATQTEASSAPGTGRQAAALPSFLPAEAGPVVERILQGGPFPHRQDGSVFANREGRLPQRPRGHYHEYTVPTPGLSHRGARRIVTGGDPPVEWYYTADHYESFRAFQAPARGVRQ